MCKYDHVCININKLFDIMAYIILCNIDIQKKLFVRIMYTINSPKCSKKKIFYQHIINKKSRVSKDYNSTTFL